MHFTEIGRRNGSQFLITVIFKNYLRWGSAKNDRELD